MTFRFQSNTVIRGIAKSLIWTLYGGTVWNPPLPSKVRSILFVCKGNICRSPFAEHMARSIIAIGARKTKPYEIFSAGIHVAGPKKPPSEAIASAKKFGIDLHEHKSRQINYHLLESYDMIIAMETGQYKFLRKLFVEFEKKIYLLPLFYIEKGQGLSAYHKYNIQDPYGRNLSDFNECFNRIERCISVLFSRIGLISGDSRERI